MEPKLSVSIHSEDSFYFDPNTCYAKSAQWENCVWAITVVTIECWSWPHETPPTNTIGTEIPVMNQAMQILSAFPSSVSQHIAATPVIHGIMIFYVHTVVTDIYYSWGACFRKV